MKLEDTVERLPSRHLALSLCAEDVKAQYEALTPETRERLNNVSSQKEVDPDTKVSLAHAHGYLKISRNPLLLVYRDVLVKDETAHESEIDLSVEPHTSCDQATDEHDVISSTRKRRRLTHKSPVSARFSDDFEEDDVIQVQADCSVPSFAENSDEKRTVVGTVGATGFEGDLLPIAMETSCQSGETEFGRHEHTVQLLEKGDDTAQLSAVFETDDTKTESCQQEKLLGLSAVAEVQRNSSSLGKGQGRNLSSMTKVFSLILAAAQHLDSSCTDCWNRAVRLGRPDILEVCANSDSPLVEAVESAGGEGLRTSFWNGYDLTTRRGRERLYQFCSAKKAKTRLVLFTLSSLWNIITTCVSYSGWNRSRGSESASTWLSRSFCTTTQRVQLETEFVAEHVREDDEGSRQRLCLGFARLTRKSLEPILASFDHISRRSTSAESSNL